MFLALFFSPVRATQFLFASALGSFASLTFSLVLKKEVEKWRKPARGTPSGKGREHPPRRAISERDSA
jgi:hypothetical protein